MSKYQFFQNFMPLKIEEKKQQLFDSPRVGNQLDTMFFSLIINI